MVLDGDGNRWNAHVDPASGNTYYVNERTGVSSWTLPKKGTTNGAASNGASPLKIALGVVIIAVLACFLPADSALRGAVPFSFPMLSRGRVLLHNAVATRTRPSRAGAWPRCGRCASSTSSPRCPVRLRCPFALCSCAPPPLCGTLCVAREPDAIDADPRDRRRAVGRAAPRGRVDAAPARRRDGRRRLCVEDEARRRRRRRPGVFPASPFPVFVIRGVPRSRG